MNSNRISDVAIKIMGRVAVLGAVLLPSFLYVGNVFSAEEGSNLIQGTGIVDFISKDTITINDMGFIVGRNLRILDKKGSGTRLYRFGEGDPVSFEFDPESNELLVLKMINKSELDKEPTVEKQERKEDTKPSRTRDEITFENGVYKN